jgi:hypothetical protein
MGGGQTWKTFIAGDTGWQEEAWRQYDINGELRYATNWVGNAVSMATLYAADVDPDTGRPAGPTENARVQEITESILGGPVQRAQAQKTIAINLSVPGEVFLLVRSGDQGAPDRWLVLSTSEIKGGVGGVEYCDPETGKDVKLTADDLLIRIWTRHPRLHRAADSPVRALLPTLREIERSSQNIAARLDSRLASAGLLPLPAGIDFPRGDDDPPGLEGFMQMIARAMSASIREPGSAAAQVPIMFEVPDEFVDRLGVISFESPLSSEILDLREKAIGRFATGMDLPPEILKGLGDSTHWNAFIVKEETYRTHLAPLLDQIADALTQAYLLPALEAAGVPDPGSFMLAFDPTDLVVQPDRLDDLLRLYDLGLISAEAIRLAAGITDDEQPTDDEAKRRLAERLVTGAPTLLEDPVLAEILGLAPVQVQAAQPAVEAPAEQPAAVTASGAQQPIELLAADIAVLHALAKAGGRLLNSHSMRGRYADTPKHEIHTQVAIEPDRVPSLLDGAFEFCGDLADAHQLGRYVAGLLESGAVHDRVLLAAWMADHG